jgi:HD superfamily phosphodiesterase
MINDQTVANIKKEVYLLFEDNTKNEYQKANWIFPHHFDIMKDMVKEMCHKYGGDLNICLAAVYLHDTGLVYNRSEESPKGHEKRSIDYSTILLHKLEVDNNTIQRINECITETCSKQEDSSIEAKILNSADALSKFKSVHFFAKASFFGDWNFFASWTINKINKSFEKIAFEDEINAIKPIRDYMIEIFNLYEKNKRCYKSIT